MQSLANLPLWDLQEAIEPSFVSVLAQLKVPFSIGMPTTIQREHVWVAGGAEGDNLNEDTGVDPSQENVTFRLHVVCTYAAAEYAGTRARFKTILAACDTAFAASGISATSDSQCRVLRWQVDEGRTDQGERQLGLTATIVSESWGE